MTVTTPLNLPRRARPDNWRGLTSMRAGEIVPIAFFPLLREDALRGSFMAQVKMAEALHTIINPIRVTMQAHLVSKVAMSRFDGSIETLNRSFANELMPGGGNPPPWDVVDANVTGKNDTGHVVLDKMGVHYGPADRISADVLETYWRIVNWERAARSKGIPLEDDDTNALAPAFWDGWKFQHIKPSFDAAMMEGVVPVSMSGTIPVGGITRLGGQGTVTAASASVSGGAMNMAIVDTASGQNGMQFQIGQNGNGIVVDLANSTGAMMSLATLETAKKTQVWAKMRERYDGIPDEYLIDMLMRGLRVPPQSFREPILIGQAQAVIGQTERYATDGASLDQSVTNGVAQLSFTMNTPPIETGGIVMVTMQIVPEQLQERIQDRMIVVNAAGDASDVPDAMADALDPQKVEVVENKYADVLHSAPTGIFGYQPLNADYARNFARVGGRYKRKADDSFLEDRQRIWAVEKADPTLSDDFYLCPSPFPHTVFADADADPFEVITIGQCSVVGLTVFGEGFEEDSDHYEKIIADIDNSRVVSVSPAALSASEDPEPVVVNEGDPE